MSANLYIIVIGIYFLILMAFNFIRAKKVKSQDDFMVAGRSLSMKVLVFTLICTWIGSGTFIAGAEFAYKSGFSSLWMPAGAWVGIIIIYFLAGKIRTFGKYTVGDILEVRYGKFARLFGAFAIIISFTAIVSYQFRAGGLILNVITQNIKSETTIIHLRDGKKITGLKPREFKAYEFSLKGNKKLTAYFLEEEKNKIFLAVSTKQYDKIPIDRVAGKPVKKVYKKKFSYFTISLKNKNNEIEKKDVLYFINFNKNFYFVPIELKSFDRSSFTSINTTGTRVTLFFDKTASSVKVIPENEKILSEYESTISVRLGQIIIGILVILFTALAGMLAVAYTDLPNGIIILFGTILALPFVWSNIGGLSGAMELLPESYFKIVNPSFGKYPVLKAFSYFLSVMFLLLGIQSMYQKFYSAKSPKDAKQATVLWIFGTVVVELFVVIIAVFATARFFGEGFDPSSMVLLAARYMVPPVVGFILFSAATVVVLSTGMNYLLSPSTNIIRDIYQRFISPNAPQKKLVLYQKITVLVLGVFALIAAMYMESVLETSYFAYVIYGVAITPALIAALAWKRATKIAGVLSIIGGTVVAITFKVLMIVLPSKYIIDGDLFGIPMIYPALGTSIILLVVVSYLTPPPTKEELSKLFPEEATK